MDCNEFIDELNRLLSPYGGNYSRPSGWLADGLAFSCVLPPIVIPFPENLSDSQREVVIRGLKSKI
jgi:hypothetical protein